MTDVPTIVVAGNHDQYRAWLARTGVDPRTHRYANTFAQLLGLRGPLRILYVGEYQKNPLFRAEDEGYLERLRRRPGVREEFEGGPS